MLYLTTVRVNQILLFFKKILKKEDKVNIVNSQNYLQEIENLQKKKFDQIKFPGGTSKDGSHYSGVIAYFFDGKKVHFLVLPYNRRYHFHGIPKEAVHTKKEGETPIETACREFLEETGLSLDPAALTEVEAARVFIPQGYTEQGTRRLDHTKRFFVCRITAMPETMTPHAPDMETSDPVLIEAGVLLKVIFKNHLNPLEEAVSMLSMEKDLCEALLDISMLRIKNPTQ